MTLLYFAWLRTRIGLAEERVDPPADIATVAQLLAWLQARGPRFADALKDLSAVRVAVNHDYVGRRARHPPRATRSRCSRRSPAAERGAVLAMIRVQAEPFDTGDRAGGA